MGKRLIRSVGTMVAVLAASTAQGQSLWDDLDSAVEATVDTANDAPPSPFTFSALTFASFATSDQGDARFSRTDKGLEESGLELTFGFQREFGARLRLKSEFVLATKDAVTSSAANETSFRAGESYFHLDATDTTWVRLGNLVIPAGTSDAFDILNVFNPSRDEIWGIDHPNGNTLPTPAAQIVALNGDFKFQLGVGLGFAGDEVAQPYQDHDYFIRDRAGTTINAASGPDDYTPEYIASVSYFGAGFDLSFVFGEVYEKRAILSGTGVDSGGLLLDADFPRYAFAGASAATTFGSWLLRGDLGYFQDQQFFDQNFYSNPTTTTGPLVSDVARGVVGVEYSGFSNTILSLEVNRNVILDWDSGMRTDRISDSAALNAQFSVLDDRLDLEFTAASFANNEATFLRAKADYAVNDTNTISVQWVDFKSNDTSGFIAPYEDADRLYVGWKTSF